MSSRRFDRSFFAAPALEVAPALLGHHLVRGNADGSTIRARIVETEAYEPGDPASHAFRGATPRNAAMFGPPGHAYVYLIYGLHHCLNVVTGRTGEGSAVLLRAAEPLGGLLGADVCRGPGRLGRAFAADRGLDGTDLVEGADLWLERVSSASAAAITAGPRVGITKGTERPWRFALAGDPWVSR
ncbi:MAG: DNA-3-methyladenine glycosylase [Actinomycetota bacterium]